MNSLHQLMQMYQMLRPNPGQGWTNVDPGMVRGSGLDNPAAGDMMEFRPQDQPPPWYSHESVQGGPRQDMSAIARLMNLG